MTAIAGCSAYSHDDGTPTAGAYATAGATGTPSQTLLAYREVARCMRDRGWDVTAENEDGGDSLTARYPIGQEGPYEADRSACFAEADVPQETLMTAQEAGEWFDKNVAAAQCLAEHGYPVTDPPSKQAYIDAAVKGTYIWSATEGVAKGSDPATFTKAGADCQV
ncbi:hypothetical protein [Cellulomonas composti]|nr:hypothetical protein [Cellulomonas composti]